MFTRHAAALTAALALASATLVADVTIVTTISMQGGPAAAPADQQTPRMVTHIKGLKSATVTEMGANASTSIVDLAGRRFIMLNSRDRTAQIIDRTAIAGKTLSVPKMDVKVTPTGKTRTIQGVECAEHTYTLAIRMDQLMGSGQVPPEAAAMMQGVSMRLNGSIWSSTTGPGAAEYMAYAKAALDQNIMQVMAEAMGLSGGIDQMLVAMAKAPGIPYLTEMTMTAEGDGEVVKMMRQMGSMQVRMEVTSVATDPVADSMFEIPEGYKIIK